MRLLFIDDHLLVRDALTHFLCQADASIFVEGAADVQEAIRRADGSSFDLILLDYRLPKISGPQAIEVMRETYPDTPIIVLSGAITLDDANNAMDLGVAGVISKSIEGKDLWTTIRAHVNGMNSISRSITTAPDSDAGQSALTRRESQVLRLLVNGLNNKQIALDLGLAEITIRLHVRQILKKLGAKSRTDAVRITLTQTL
jgi:DNA-binding NarL/FixJ family response regulator